MNAAADQRGRFWRDASDRLVFELYRVDANDYRAVCELLVREFGLQASAQLVDRWDVLFRNFTGLPGVVSLEWDNWTGFTVVAKEESAEPAVKDIGMFLQTSRKVAQFIRSA